MTRSTKSMPKLTDSAADRLAWERKAIEKAREDIRLGHCIPDEEVDALLERFVNGSGPIPLSEQVIKTARD